VLSEKNWKPEALLRLFVGVCACIIIGSVLIGVGRGADGAKDELPIGRLIAAVVSFQGVGLVLIWRFLHEHQISWSAAFGFPHDPSRALGWGTAAAMLFLPVGWLLQTFSAEMMTRLHLDPVAQSAVEILRDVRGPGLAVFALLTIVVVPVAEEMLFRGILYPAIKQAGFPRLAMWGTSVFFAGIHFNLAAFVPLLVLSLVLIWLYEKTDNLLATITAHSLFNTANLAMFFLADEFSRTLPSQP
jgi:uncharacterized protein